MEKIKALYMHYTRKFAQKLFIFIAIGALHKKQMENVTQLPTEINDANILPQHLLLAPTQAIEQCHLLTIKNPQKYQAVVATTVIVFAQLRYYILKMLCNTVPFFFLLRCKGINFSHFQVKHANMLPDMRAFCNFILCKKYVAHF